MKQPYTLGADKKSPYDVRTFTFKPTKANIKGGQRYLPEDIQDQSKVGICTAISHTQQASKVLGIKMSADFHYLIQKKFIDGNWDEGSAIISSIKVGNKYGFLPEKEWTYTTQKDRDAGYTKYIKKLQSVPQKEIDRLLEIAKQYKTVGYQSVPTDRDAMADAIDQSQAGILTRMVVGSEWWTNPIQPLRRAISPISGHAITQSNYDGNSFRIANSWGSDWAENGTAYYTLSTNEPTEAWIVYYTATTPELDEQKESRATIVGQIMDLLQKVIVLLQKLI